MKGDTTSAVEISYSSLPFLSSFDLSFFPFYTKPSHHGYYALVQAKPVNLGLSIFRISLLYWAHPPGECQLAPRCSPSRPSTSICGHFAFPLLHSNSFLHHVLLLSLNNDWRRWGYLAVKVVRSYLLNMDDRNGGESV